MNEDVYISKKMSYALRHNPQKYGLQLDQYGYTDIHSFIDALNRVHHITPPITIERIKMVMEHSNKERFKIKNGKICALYGHSISGIISHRQATPPDILCHGTARRFIPSIKKLGLLPMKRQYVHLSTDIPMARQVGGRHDSHPVILRINTKVAVANGIKFYVGNDEVWLCDELPAEYIEFP
ncbi:RNA 2'-phosphotransferase [Limosilactobacillus coleohominis]|uniref:RNA 2'-phosphotransferase n=1 Tax=Limosilactobacillus coleohominis TaxID=181675 RepID=UPI001959BEEC|nr:RNA 2'-phosphotransferase [Limosilactobacillus coleohominis]MBM6955096.1 RNA 2'-phosphotransferase [Limosilactobacillus coleohominis]